MGTQTPGSRFRVQQFFPHFRRLGVHPTLRTAYGDDYNVHSARRYAPAYKLASRLRRSAYAVTAGRYDVVYAHSTALRYTALPERLSAALNRSLILDIDDAVYLGSTGQPNRWASGAFDAAVAAAAHVVVGNETLAERAGVPHKTTIIPTVIDTDRYTPAGTVSAGPFRLGWMGTSGNFPVLAGVVPAVEAFLASRPEARFRIVSNRPFAPLAGHPQVEEIPWSAERELDLLRSFTVGIMPLTDTAWNRGKCAFKLIQYMAVGVPVLGSAVGANREVVADGEVGYLVPTTDDWLDSFERIEGDDLVGMGLRARSRAVSHYSIDSVLPTYCDLFRRVAAR